MPTAPLVYKKAHIDGVSEDHSFLSSAMRRASPRPNPTPPDPATDASPHEVSSLLSATSVQQGDETKPSSLELPRSHASTAASLHARQALLVHAVLGFRYCLLPLSALVVSGSVAVVSSTAPPPPCNSVLRATAAEPFRATTQHFADTSVAVACRGSSRSPWLDSSRSGRCALSLSTWPLARMRSGGAPCARPARARGSR